MVAKSRHEAMGSSRALWHEVALTGLDFNDPAAQITCRQRVHAQCRDCVEYVCERPDKLS